MLKTTPKMLKNVKIWPINLKTEIAQGSYTMPNVISLELSLELSFTTWGQVQQLPTSAM